LRLPVLLLSAAALALGACNTGTTTASNDTSSQVDPGSDVSDKDLEKQVMAALDTAPQNGLTKDLFLKGDLPSDGAARRQALLSALNGYASALANGKVDPNKIRDVYTIDRPKADVSAGLKQALQQNKLKEWLASLAPQTPEYKALSQAFVKLVQRSPDLPDQDIPSNGDTIHPGGSDPRIPAIVANLKAQGYLADGTTKGDGKASDAKQQQAAASAGNRYTPQLVDAVKQWQADSGLKSDGVIGPNTIQALNASPRDRARQIAVAMERLRWLDRNPPSTRIDVNTAASFLDYFRDGQHIDQRKVIEGEPGKETPQLGAPIFQLVANPTWTVPHSIDDEIDSKSSGWLASNNFTKKDGSWVQESGPQNSLGIVKFDMKDDQAIYLHDTPAKSLFAQDDRHRSHGCVRVQDAIGFAHMLAKADGIDDKFSKAMATGEETFVKLNHEIPVRLMYHTAYLGNDGRLHFAQDVYGWDNDVATALGYQTKAPVKSTGAASDIGP
jgi:murein L,D-transpeptidase YcbB/YkuD